MAQRRKIRFDNHPQLPFAEWEEEASMPTDNQHSNNADHLNNRHNNRQTDSRYTDIDEDSPSDVKSPERLFYVSLGSGSSGNSCYLGTEEGGIIVDAGLRCDDIESKLRARGISMQRVKGLLLTHDHSDHVRYAYNLLRNHRHITLYCTPRVLNGLLRRHSISKRIKEYHTPIFKEIPFKIGRFEITAFDVPHDGSDNMGFSVDFEGRKFVLATDLGAISDRARYYMSQANYLVIEANYDADMLRYGPYPEYLKARIRNGSGHLDNVITAEFVSEIANPDLHYVFLCHLSKDNNTPVKAVRAVRDALESKGLTVGSAQESLLDRKADIQLMALPRYDATRCFVFRK